MNSKTHDLKRNLNGLIDPLPPDGGRLAEPKARGNQGASQGLGKIKRADNPPGGLGIAFPLVEDSYAARTWHVASLTHHDVGGAWTFVWDTLHEAQLRDGADNTGPLSLAAPGT